MKRLLLTSFDGGGKLAFGACRHVVIAGSEAKKRQKSRKMSLFLAFYLHMSKKQYLCTRNEIEKCSFKHTNLIEKCSFRQ